VYRHIGLEQRLREMIEDPAISELLRLPKITVPPHQREGEDANVTNIHQSQAWWDKVVKGKGRGNHCRPDFGTENNGRNIVLSLNIDGFQPYKVSNSLTPLVAMILNLPEHLRHQPRFLNLIGMIPGPKSPTSLNAYLDVLVDELIPLYEEGFEVVEPGKKDPIRVRVKLLNTCADYPAHNQMNCQQGASATYGCIKCLIKVSLHTLRRGKRVVVPPVSDIAAICYHCSLVSAIVCHCLSLLSLLGCP
jgi:hypothetical protein